MIRWAKESILFAPPYQLLPDNDGKVGNFVIIFARNPMYLQHCEKAPTFSPIVADRGDMSAKSVSVVAFPSAE